MDLFECAVIFLFEKPTMDSRERSLVEYYGGIKLAEKLMADLPKHELSTKHDSVTH